MAGVDRRRHNADVHLNIGKPLHVRLLYAVFGRCCTTKYECCYGGYRMRLSSNSCGVGYLVVVVERGIAFAFGEMQESEKGLVVFRLVLGASYFECEETAGVLNDEVRCELSDVA